MSVTNNNLDLTDVESEDYESLVQKINSFYSTEATNKAELAKHWERNSLMLDGKQWLVYEGSSATGGMWKRLNLTRGNDFIPRPVSNLLYSAYQTLKSYLIKNKPRSKVYPNTSSSHKDKMAAKIATLCLEANWSMLREDYNYEFAAANLLTYGTVFKKSYWDTSHTRLVKVPLMEDIPTTDPITGMVIGSTQIQKSDPITGDLMFEELPLGNLATTIVDPFRICIDPLAMHLFDARWVMEYSVQPLDWIQDVYGREGDGFTGKAEEVEPEKELNGSLRRWFQLKTSSGLRDSSSLGSTSGSGSSDTMLENCAVVKEYYERPSRSYPNGRLIVIANDQCVYSGDSPYSGDDLGDWHPYSECRWEMVPGRFWGKGPLDDGVELQKQINSIDSVIALTRKTMAIPQKRIPMGCGVTPGTFTGRPGLEIYYRNDGAGGVPENIPGMGVDASVFQERAQRVADFKEITGATDIIKGDAPPNVSAASAFNMLYEVGTGKLFPVLDRWKMCVESDQKKQLKIIQKRFKEPRPDFIRWLKSQNSDLNESDINNFIGEDLHDNFNVVVEAGSNIPKLQAAKQGMLIELAQMGMLNLQSPGNRSQFQKDMGIMGYDSDIEPDSNRAEWENTLLDDLPYSPDNQPVVLDADNHAIHIQVHQSRMKSPTFMALSLDIQKAYMNHIAQHENLQNAQMKAQMLQQQAMAPAPGTPVSAQPQGAPQAPPPGANYAQAQGASKGHGKGLTKDLKQSLIGGDVLTPAALGDGRA